MKKVILAAVFVLLSFVGNAQESKVYMGMSFGSSEPGGEIASNFEKGRSFGMLNFGYRFTDQWGAVLNWSSSSHKIEDYDIHINIAYVAVGPMFTLPLNEKFALDIKPQYVIGMTGIYDDDIYASVVVDEVNGNDISRSVWIEDFTMKGNAFLLGTSLNYGMSKGIKFSINLDYLSGEFNEFTGKVAGKSTEFENYAFNAFTNLSIGVGIRYNF